MNRQGGKSLEAPVTLAPEATINADQGRLRAAHARYRGSSDDSSLQPHRRIAASPHRRIANRLIVGGKVQPVAAANVLDQRLPHRGQPQLDT